MDSKLLSCFHFDDDFKQLGNKYFSDCFLKDIQNWKNFYEKYSLKQYKELSSYANRAKASCSSLFRVESPILPQIVLSKNFYIYLYQFQISRWPWIPVGSLHKNWPELPPRANLQAWKWPPIHWNCFNVVTHGIHINMLYCVNELHCT